MISLDKKQHLVIPRAVSDRSTVLDLIFHLTVQAICSDPGDRAVGLAATVETFLKRLETPAARALALVPAPGLLFAERRPRRFQAKSV